MGADRAAGHLVRDVEQQRDVGLEAAAGRDTLGDTGEPEGAFAAGRALAAGLVGVEGVEIGECLDHLDGVVDDDGAAGAEARAARGDAVGIERDVLERPVELGAVGELALEAFADLEDLGGGTAGDDRLDRASIERAAAEVVEQFAEGGLAGFDLVETRALD